MFSLLHIPTHGEGYIASLQLTCLLQLLEVWYKNYERFLLTSKAVMCKLHLALLVKRMGHKDKSKYMIYALHVL